MGSFWRRDDAEESTWAASSHAGEENKPADDDLLTTVNLEETTEVISDEVPDMWRIDAAEVDLDDIYSQEEQVIVEMI